MSFPITIVRKSLRYRMGNKDYHGVLLTNADKKAVLIFRWGKAGQWGQMKVEAFDNAEAAEREFESKLRAKEAKGYDNELLNRVDTADNVAELQSVLGASYWSNIGKKNLDHICEGAPTAGVKDEPPEPAEWEKVGDRYVPKDRKPKEPTVEELAAADPEWGTW